MVSSLIVFRVVNLEVVIVVMKHLSDFCGVPTYILLEGDRLTHEALVQTHEALVHTGLDS